MDHLKSDLMLLFLIMTCLMLLSYGCGCPPTQEIADAEVALSAAKTAGAEKYAPQEYESAESKLDKARWEVERYHYVNGRALAIEAKDTALLAKKIAEGADKQLFDKASNAIEAAKKALKDAEAAGAEKYDPEGYRSVIALIGEAEKALSEKKYDIAINNAEEARQKARRLELASKRAKEMEYAEKEKKAVISPTPTPPPPPSPPAAKVVKTESTYDKHVVQKGECLWTISEYEKVYANPFMWPLIYKANRSQIKDPDLVFPGQNLDISRNHGREEINSAIYQAKHRGPWSLFDGK